MSDQLKMEIDFSQVEETQSNFPTKAKPGVYESLTITGMEFGTSTKKGTPYAKVTVVTTDGEQAQDTFYLTPKSLGKLKHLLTNAGVPESIITTKTTAEQLAKVSIGKKVHARLDGREFLKDGKVYITTQFGFSGFAQPAGGPCTLTFDPNKHIERLPKDIAPDSSDMNVLDIPMAGGETNDLPF